MAIGIISLGVSFFAFIVAGLTYIQQNHIEDVVVYTEEVNGDFFIVIENIGTKTAHNYFLELNMEQSIIPGDLREFIKEMPVFHRKEGFTLPPNKSIRFSIGSHLDTSEEKGDIRRMQNGEWIVKKTLEMPTLKITVFKMLLRKLSNNDFRKKGSYELNYNAYKHVFLYETDSRRISNSLKKIESKTKRNSRLHNIRRF